MSDYIEIYTDGACSGNQFSDGVGGWAFLIKYSEHEKVGYGSEENTTNNRMEILAVIKALQTIKKTNLKVVVYSDSQYVVQTINSNWKKNKNNDLWLILEDEIKRFDKIDFIQVKGHSNNRFNNYVDELAVRATKIHTQISNNQNQTANSKYEESIKILNEYRNKNYNSSNKDEAKLANAIDVILPKLVKQEELLNKLKEMIDYKDDEN